jgi:hypothetical protein
MLTGHSTSNINRCGRDMQKAYRLPSVLEVELADITFVSVRLQR